MSAHAKAPNNTPLLASWIRSNTQDAVCVVDFGSGFFDKLDYVPPMCKKIGIEVFPAYLSYAKAGIKAICGDFRNWERYVSGPELDVAMIIDTIEHIPKDEGLALLERLKGAFRRVLVFTPDGFHPQYDDVTGFGNEYQVHECGWSASDFEQLGYSVVTHPEFHGEKGGALFAIWPRP